jgi:hypothetical protein
MATSKKNGVSSNWNPIKHTYLAVAVIGPQTKLTASTHPICLSYCNFLFFQYISIPISPVHSLISVFIAKITNKSGPRE